MPSVSPNGPSDPEHLGNLDFTDLSIPDSSWFSMANLILTINVLFDQSPTNQAGQLQVDRTGLMYARVVQRLSPQWGYLPVLNTYLETHKVTNWRIADILLNLLVQTAVKSSTDPVWAFQPGGPPPLIPPGPQPPITTGPPPPIGGPPVTINPTLPPPPAFPMPCQPQNNPDGDEIQDLQDCLAANLGTIAGLLNKLIAQGYAPISGGSGGTQNDCCKALVTAITGGLSAIATVISTATSNPGSNAAPIDLTAVVTSLAAIATALGSYPAIGQALATAVGANLDKIATAISSLGPIDLAHLNAAADGQVADRTVAQVEADALYAGSQTDYSNIVGNQ